MTSRLEEHRENVFSQFGEDGMILAALQMLPDLEKWCVEFGAWDGRYASNTHRLMTEERWSGVFIESKPNRFQDLLRTYAGNDRATCINALVGLAGPNSLDSILSRTPIPKEFGVLSIDVDGDDWHIWHSLSTYRPALVLIEFNPTIPPDIDYVQPAGTHKGSSLAALARLGTNKGYELVAASYCNAFFVQEHLFSLFGLEDNSPEVIHHGRHQTRVFQLFDGTLCFEGCTQLLWHDVSFRRLQLIPRWARTLPGSERTFGARLRRKLVVEYLRRRG
jgi:hypothetical protein